MRRRIRHSQLPSQRLFHRLKERFKGFSGPVGSGKSQALCQEAIRLSYVNSGRMGLIGAPTYPMLRDATQVALLGVLEKNKVPFEFNKAESTLTFKETGSKILFRSMDDYERLRGTNLAWFGIDELTYTREDAWIRLEARLRDPEAKKLCGFGVWTPKGFDWVHRRFIQNAREGYGCVLAQASENRYLLKRVPDFYERLKRSYDESFYRQEVLGEYLSPSSGRVYFCFDREVNVAEQTADPRRPLLWSLDFNVNPMCSLVVQRDGENMRVLDEIVMKRASTIDACEEFVRRYPAWGAGLRVYGDASCRAMQTTGASDVAMIQDFVAQYGRFSVSYRIPKANPSVQSRVRLVNAKLGAANGEATLAIDPRCTELIADCEEVSYVAESLEIDKARDGGRTHLSDALGYVLWQEFGPKQPVAGPRSDRRLL